MTHREQNAEKGYIFVSQTSHEHEVYKKRNEVGGWTYYSDENGPFFVVWDTALSDSETLQILYNDIIK